MNKTISTTAMNPYLHWLCQNGVPPLHASLSQAEDAVNLFKALVNKASHYTVVAKMNRAHLMRALTLLQQIYAFRSFLDSQSAVRRDFDDEKVFQLREHSSQLADRLNRLWTRSKVRNVLKRMAKSPKHKDIHALLTETLNSCEEVDDSGALEAVLKVHEKDEFEFAQKSEQHQALLSKEFVVTTKKMPYYNSGSLKIAKQKAKSMGIHGYAFQLNADESSSLKFSVHGEVRKEFLYKSDTSAYNEHEIDEKIASRNLYARLKNFNDYAAYSLRDGLISNPRVLTNSFRKSLSHIRPLVNAYAQEMTAWGQEKHGTTVAGDDLLAPWNAPAFEGDYDTEEGLDTTNIFPWMETAPKVITSLMQKAGWSMAAPIASMGSGKYTVFHFVLEKNGRLSHLIYNPFRPKSNGADYSAASALAILNHWNGDGNERSGMVWIDQNLDDNCFGETDLVHLCHELGHALHYMEMEGKHPEEMVMTCEDLYEIPSHMMELFVKDPQVMASWVSSSAPIKYKKVDFWKSRKETGANSVIHLQNMMMNSLIDLELHIQGEEKGCLEIIEDNYVEQGRIFHADYMGNLNHFVHEKNFSCLDYQQIFPRGMARKFIPVSKEGNTNAQLVTDLVLSVIHEVLNKGMDRNKVKRAWKQWSGMTFNQSFNESLELLTQDAIKYTKKVMKQRKDH